jgi:hypothetical protein
MGWRLPFYARCGAGGRWGTEQMAGERSWRPANEVGAMKAEAVARVATKRVSARIAGISGVEITESRPPKNFPRTTVESMD